MKAFLLGILKIAGLLAAFMVLGAVAPRVGQGIALLALALGGIAIEYGESLTSPFATEIARICLLIAY